MEQINSSKAFLWWIMNATYFACVEQNFITYLGIFYACPLKVVLAQVRKK